MLYAYITPEVLPESQCIFKSGRSTIVFYDNSALVAHQSDDKQTLVNKFANAAKDFAFKINIKKTE